MKTTLLSQNNQWLMPPVASIVNIFFTRCDQSSVSSNNDPWAND